MAFQIMLVILVIMLMMLLPVVKVIGLLLCSNILSWLLYLNLTRYILVWVQKWLASFNAGKTQVFYWIIQKAMVYESTGYFKEFYFTTVFGLRLSLHCDSEMLAAFLYTEGVQILVGAIELLGAPSRFKVKPLWDPEHKSSGKFMIH